MRTQRPSVLPHYASVLPTLSLAAIVCFGYWQPASAQTTSVSYRVVRDVARNDTLNARVVNGNAVIYDATASAHFGPGGNYRVRWHGDPFGIRDGSYPRLAPVAILQRGLDEALGARPVATTTTTDPGVRSLPNFPEDPAGRPLIAVRLPFELVGADGLQAVAIMFQRHRSGDAADSLLRNSRLFGTGADTVSVQIPPNAWLPGDTLYVVENLTAGRAISTRLVLGCAPGGTPRRTTCNPLALGTTGATSYLPLAAGYESVWSLPPASAR